ncbi:DNA polymerase III subunit epsilon [Alcanivorax hongdengensis A-11-3]|uniref:DNA polymerase III subunit epsilon n=1 Tax=Alcanivorax hongdengensis A-11-3 TaxID=1177179 RepID=L0WGR9_9GAMM|nr:3'-5' exonuclease [Alcanivorax hongdengensis]EKF75884.1 DNA polymerase III subunit epsilon [Alcanivorax hongdengensis A-11-3]
MSGMWQQLRRRMDRYLHGHGPYQHLFAPYDGNEVVAIDCETTGLDRQAELVSLGAVVVCPQRVCSGSALELHLQPPQSLAADSIRIHRLRPMDLDQGVALEEALTRLLDFIGNRPLVGWCVAFDVAVINRYLRPLMGFDLPNRVIELAGLYQRKWRYWQPDMQPDLRFEAMAKALDVPIMERHTARGDAIMAGLMYLRLQQLESAPH